ncbi:NUDIX hydrolase [Tamaricihabitans halophyticus]|uniref:NUDIX hydrolase n=1 Tax=Tamaricihabitans halophyticus TaxID=1262583 RepID=UPI003C70D300
MHAAGAVLWREPAPEQPLSDGSIEVALVHRPRYDDWSLPKGKLDPGETMAAAAAREVHEETGYSAILGRYLGAANYSVPSTENTGGIPKRVEYFSARAMAGHFQANDEVDELRWFTPTAARKLLSYPDDAEILTRFTALPPRQHSLLLIRHAKAGKRQEWTGDDDLRPLSTVGSTQAAALRTLLPLFGPTDVHAAPRLRCVQTVQGLADDLGLPVVMEPELTEESYRKDPDAAVARLREIARTGRTPVVSSQGGAIPGLVAMLAEQAELVVGPVTSKKASVWQLSFAVGNQSAGNRAVTNNVGENPATPQLIAANYFPSPLPAPSGE